MGKAVLIIKMPKKCSECELFANESQVCLATRKMVDESIVGDIKIGWCPLKTLPNYIYSSPEPPNEYEKQIYQTGFNDCLDEILGDTE